MLFTTFLSFFINNYFPIDKINIDKIRLLIENNRLVLQINFFTFIIQSYQTRIII